MQAINMHGLLYVFKIVDLDRDSCYIDVKRKPKKTVDQLWLKGRPSP